MSPQAKNISVAAILQAVIIFLLIAAIGGMLAIAQERPVNKIQRDANTERSLKNKEVNEQQNEAIRDITDKVSDNNVVLHSLYKGLKREHNLPDIEVIKALQEEQR